MVAAGFMGCGSATSPTPAPGESPSRPLGPLAVIADRVAGTLLTLEVDPLTGVPKLVASMPVSDPSFLSTSSMLPEPDFVPWPFFLAPDPQGRFVYLAGGGYIHSYAIDKGTGRLTERSTQPAVSPWKYILSMTASGRYVYLRWTAGNIGSRIRLVRYAVDANTGVLGPCVAPSAGAPDPDGCWALPFRFDPGFLLASTDDRFVYADDNGAQVATSARQPDGSILDVGQVPLPDTDASPTAALGPGFLAVAGDYLQTLAIDANTGLLSPRQLIPDTFPVASGAPGWADITVSIAGLVGVLGHPPGESWLLETWWVDPAGMLSRRAEIHLADAKTRDSAFDPSGRFLYVTGSDGVHAFAVAADGGLRETGTYAVGTGPIVMIPR